MSGTDDDEHEVHEVYRDGKVHVLREKCSSCIFRSKNDGRIEGLAPGRVAGMVQGARDDDSCIPCHNTIRRSDVQPAICRGFYDLPRQPMPIQVADRLNLIEFDPAPPKE